MGRASLGELELTLLQYITDHAPLSVGEAAEWFGKPQGLARTTILTVMERLRKKGYLTRAKEDGLFRYKPCMPKSELLRVMVGEFTSRVLGGSLQPFVAYLAGDARVTDADLKELRALVEQLDARRKEDTHE
ncbi:MAG: BlaI/MecI/CopY family transcriptional regulator [Armatimonadota bacterium]